MTFYTHLRDVPAAGRRWANFSPAEIACRGTGVLLVNEAVPRQAAGAAGSVRQAEPLP